MAIREMPVTSHLLGTGNEELRRLRLWQQTITPSSPVEGIFWLGSNIGDKRIYFYDGVLGAGVAVPRLDRDEAVTGQWSFSPAGVQPPFVLNSNAQGQKVVGLNADLLDGYNADTTNTASTVAVRDASGRLSVSDPVANLDAVNLQSMTAAITAATINVSQLTGILPLTKGGTGADLSAVGATGGLVWKNGSALTITAALTGVLIGNGGSAPTATATLPIANGGTNASTASVARTNLSVLFSDDILGGINTRLPIGGLFFSTAVTNVVTGTTGVNLGLSDFSIAFTIILDSRITGGISRIFSTHSAGNNRMMVEYNSAGGYFSTLVVDNSGVTINFQRTPNVALAFDTLYFVVITCSRTGNNTLYVNGNSVAGSFASAAGVNIGSGNANVYCIGGSTSIFTLGSLTVFNKELTSTEVTALTYQGTIRAIEQWGSFSAAYSSNFTANADSFTNTTGMTSTTGNIDGISDGTTSKDDVLRLTCAAGGTTHDSSRTATVTVNKRYRVTVDYYIPSGQTVNGVRLGTSDITTPGAFFDLTTTGAWTTGSAEYTAKAATGTFFIWLLHNSSTSFTGISGEVAYFKNFVITEVGAVLDLDFIHADPAITLTVKDRTAFANHGTTLSTAAQLSRTPLLNIGDINVGSLTQNTVVYGGASGAIIGLALNTTATVKFLTQVSSSAPAWTDLYGSSPTWTGNHTFSGTIIVPTPVSDSQAATKAYVDSAASSGLRPLVNGPCQVASTGNLTLSGEQTIDGVLTSASRVLVKDQSTPSQNGVYVSAAGAWSRAVDADTAGEITKGAYVYITSGTANAGTSWYETATVTTVNTDAVAWIKFFQQAAFIAGVGISIGGLTISVDQTFSPTWTGAHAFQNANGVSLQPYGSSTGNTTTLKFFELAANGTNFVGFKAPDSIVADVTWMLPSADGSANTYLKTNGSGVLSFAQVASAEISNSSFVTSVTGTTNRITVSAGLTPIVDIDAAYVGQATITTLGTITTGTWTATVIGVAYGGTSFSSYTTGDLIYASGGAALAKLGVGATNKFLTVAAGLPSWSAWALPAAVSANQLLYGNGSNTSAALATVASRVLTTDGSGNLGWNNTLPTGLSVAGDTSSKVAKIQWFNVGDGASTTITLTHNYGTRDVVVEVYEATTGYRSVMVAAARTTTNTVDIEFVVAPALNAYRAAVLCAI